MHEIAVIFQLLETIFSIHQTTRTFTAQCACNEQSDLLRDSLDCCLLLIVTGNYFPLFSNYRHCYSIDRSVSYQIATNSATSKMMNRLIIKGKLSISWICRRNSVSIVSLESLRFKCTSKRTQNCQIKFSYVISNLLFVQRSLPH